MRDRVGMVVLVAALVLSVIPAVLTGWVVVVDEEVPDLVSDIVPLMSRPEYVEHDERMAVMVELASVEGEEVGAPPWNGTVTEVAVRPGVVVREGQVLLEVDGIDRISYAGTRPFHRDLRTRDRGEDVLELQRFLLRLGYLAEDDADGVFGSSTGRAVQALSLSLGVSPTVASFSADWVVWIPDGFEVAEVMVAPGLRLHADGGTFLSAPSRLQAAGLLPAHDDERIELDPATEWVLELSDPDLALEVDAATREVTGGGLLELEAAGLGTVTDPLVGFIRRRVPLDAFAIPAPAVVSGVDALCVWVADEEGSVPDTFEPIPVLFLDRGLRRTIVSGSLVDRQVLANPAEMGLTSCS